MRDAEALVCPWQRMRKELHSEERCSGGTLCMVMEMAVDIPKKQEQVIIALLS